MKKWLSFLCALALVVTLTLPLLGSVAVSADNASPKAAKSLYQQILERDGFIEGVWYPWFTHDYLGCGFTSNEVAAQYITNGWYDFKKVGIDHYGADKIYAEIYNLKAMGYNMLAIAGSPYGEGVIYDANGDVLGIKDEYLQNVRRFLDICREIGMPLMWNICFHSSSMPDYYGMDAWNIICRMYGDNTVADHYAERFVKPLCELFDEYDDVVALLALTDEIENEINDSDMPNRNASKAYGATKEDIHYFVNAMNEAVKATVPHIARTIAANSDDLGMYSDIDVDLLGRNRYSDNGDAAKLPGMYPSAPMLLTEYNLATASGMNETQYSKVQLNFRNTMKEYGYDGGFMWCWQPNVRGGAMDMLAANATSNTDFRQSMYDVYYYTMDARAAYQNKKVVLDTPSLFYYGGDGLLEWVPSRQATKVTIEKSSDGKKWTTVAADIDPATLLKNDKCVYQAKNVIATDYYRVTVADGKGNTASAVTNNPGAAAAYIGTPKTATVTQIKRPAIVKASVDFSSTTNLRLTSFGVDANRPQNVISNVITNPGFENESGGQWNNRTFLSNTVTVVDDPTAPEGDKSLHFDTRGTDTPQWYTFKVAVQPNTDYVFSAWVKGAYVSDDNRFYASIGILNPYTKNFAVYPSMEDRRSRRDGQIYPTAWDNEWHLRSVTFNSGNLTEVVIGLYGCSSEMWVDDLALFKNGYGQSYLSATAKASVTFSYNYQFMRCDPAKSLTQNVRMDDAKSTYWQDGAGWDNGFMSIVDTDYVYGTAMKYTASEKAAGISYIKWIPVKKNAEYVITFNYKVLKDGNGYVRLATERGNGLSHFVSVDFFGTSMYEDENGWCTFSTKIYTTAFDKIAFIVTDLGGEALIDNIRIFNPDDGSDVSDLPGDSGSTDSTTTVPVVRPTTTQSTLPTTTTTAATKPVTYPSTTVGDTTDPTVTDPTAGDVTDPTVTDPTTTLTQGDATDPTSSVADAESQPADTTPYEHTHPVILWVGIAVALVLAGGIVAFLLLRKKSK